MPAPTGNIKVNLVGRGPLTIRPVDYIATGGEGSIYQANSTVIKLYSDLKKMSRDGMADKIRLLSGLKHKFIIAPENVVTDSSGREIGYYMPYAGGEALSLVFTSSFRQKNKFGDKDANTLVNHMRDAMRFAHDHKAIMVDPNELNWKVEFFSTGPEPRVLDVDSWAIGKWPASVIMPSIRDWHAPRFNELTDWFAWGIVTFQIFTGIHPYKGNLSGFGRYELEKRMKANASVFSPGIQLNNAVRDFNCIPGVLCEWYKATFQNGERAVPPSPFDTAIIKPTPAILRQKVVITATGSLVFESLFNRVNDPIIRVWPCGVVLCASGELFDLNSRRAIGRMNSSDGEIVKVDSGWLSADKIHGRLVFSYIDDRTNVSTPLEFLMEGHYILRYENRLFLVTESNLIELNFMMAGRPILSVGQRTAILQPKATRWFDGVGIQEALGATFMITPFGEKSCLTTRVRELDGLKPITAKAGNRFVCIIAINKQGEYKKLSFYFDRDYSSYRFSQETVDNAELNMCILPKGVCAEIVNDGELEIFVPSTAQVNKVRDRLITTTISLNNIGDRVVYIDDQGQLWSVKLK